MLKFFNAVCKTAVISLFLQKSQPQDVQFQLLPHHIKFHPEAEQIKSEREIEANRFCLVLTLWPPVTVKVSEGGIKWEKSMVPISMACMKKIGRTVCMPASKPNTTRYITISVWYSYRSIKRKQEREIEGRRGRGDKKKRKAGRAIAQHIHIHNTFKTSSQSSPLHDQPLPMFGSFHTTIQ